MYSIGDNVLLKNGSVATIEAIIYGAVFGSLDYNIDEYIVAINGRQGNSVLPNEIDKLSN